MNLSVSFYLTRNKTYVNGHFNVAKCVSFTYAQDIDKIVHLVNINGRHFKHFKIFVERVLRLSYLSFCCYS